MPFLIMTVDDFLHERDNVKEVRQRHLKQLQQQWEPECVLRLLNTKIAATRLIRENQEWFDQMGGRYWNPPMCNGIYFESTADAIAAKFALEA